MLYVCCFVFECVFNQLRVVLSPCGLQWLHACLCVCFLVYLICLFTYLPVCPFDCVFVCWLARLSVCFLLCVCVLDCFIVCVCCELC